MHDGSCDMIPDGLIHSVSALASQPHPWPFGWCGMSPVKPACVAVASQMWPPHDGAFCAVNVRSETAYWSANALNAGICDGVRYVRQLFVPGERQPLPRIPQPSIFPPSIAFACVPIPWGGSVVMMSGLGVIGTVVPSFSRTGPT